MRTITCGKCQHSKPVEMFYFRRTEKRYHAWCKTCLYEFQATRWRERKQRAVEMLGGACSQCGYNRSLAALVFHHRDRRTKEFDWNKLRLRPWDVIVAELEKCTLVCANCHAEIHSTAVGAEHGAASATAVHVGDLYGSE